MPKPLSNQIAGQLHTGQKEHGWPSHHCGSPQSDSGSGISITNPLNLLLPFLWEGTKERGEMPVMEMQHPLVKDTVSLRRNV